MIGFLIFAFIVAVIVMRIGLSRKVKRLELDLTNSNDEIRILTKRVSVLEQALRYNSSETKTPSEPEEFIITAVQDKASTFKNSPKIESCSSSAGRPIKEQPTPLTSPLRTSASKIQTPVKHRFHAEPVAQTFWQKAEKQIAENWTGIVGTIVLVLGIGFLGVYTALKMTEVIRFLMIVGCSFAMAVVFFVLRKKEKWIKLSLWMRSASGAVFLFACLGAGGIPGLYWIHSPMWGLIVLLLGIALNLFLAVIGSMQVFASLHVLLGLVALSIAPQNDTTLIIASSVAVFGIALTFREKWDYHLLLSISSFFAYHTFWYFKLGGKAAFTDSQNILGILIVSVVCILAAYVHYRKLYGSRQFDRIPFMVHLVNWLYFGLGLLMHVSDTKWRIIPLFAGAAIAFILANYARKLKIRWLHCTDTLIAQIITIIGVISLAKWDIDYDIVMTILFLQVLAFTRIVILVREDILFRAGIAAIQVSGIAVVVTFTIIGNLRAITYYASGKAPWRLLAWQAS